MSACIPLTTSELPPVVTLPQPQWYAIHTRAKHEKCVAAELEKKGVPHYLPLVQQVHRWSDRRKIVHLPLFSCYAFVRAVLDAEARAAIMKIWGVLGFVGPQNLGTAIPESQIEGVRALLASNMPFLPHPFLKVGQRVRVCGGALAGLEGILVSNRNRHLILSVEGIERSFSVCIDGCDVEPV
jgi:transcription termination/antitermination protein NusG